MKAGDGGNGRRGTDGRGGSDSKDSTIAPTNGTYGATTGGAAGETGVAYLYGTPSDDTSTTSNAVELSASASDGTKNSDIVPSANDGTAGTRGNDGWGGLNLYLTGEDANGRLSSGCKGTDPTYTQKPYLNGLSGQESSSNIRQTQAGVKFLDTGSEKSVTFDGDCLQVKTIRGQSLNYKYSEYSPNASITTRVYYPDYYFNLHTILASTNIWLETSANRYAVYIINDLGLYNEYNNYVAGLSEAKCYNYLGSAV